MYRCRVWPTANFAIRSQRNRTQPLSGSSNLIRFSELQSSTLWNQYSSNKLLTNGGFSSTIAAPNGTFTMNQFTPSANGGVYQTFAAGGTSIAGGQIFTVSAWLASTTGTTAGGFSYYDGLDGTPVTFTLTTTPTRYSATFTLTTSPGPNFSVSNVTVMGVTSAVPILWWGYQLERGSTMTQYTKKL